MTQAVPVRAEVLINATPHESRVAIVENGQVQYIYIDRPDLQGILGNIYKGRISRVLPGMQAAFVDIGLERAGFLHVSDIMPFREEGEECDLNAPEADIRKWAREGEEVLVQVVKDPLGSKGARLSKHLSIASRYLVFMPDLNHVGVSLRLEDEGERNRLATLVDKLLGGDKSAHGYIIRTAAEGVNTEAIKQDIDFLHKAWAVVQKAAKKASCPSVVYEDLPLLKRVVRDMVTPDVEVVRIDDHACYEALCDFTQQFVPVVKDKITLYQSETPIFEMHAIESELKKALKRNVSLKSGGYLVIDQTEAMTTIDINTGSFSARNLEETIFKTNLEAAQAIARQLRLRNLGGIIIVDFIDMLEEEHKKELFNTFQKALERDHAKTNISEVSSLGLIQMTRKRTQESLEQQLCEVCHSCEGGGRLKTRQTMAYELYRALMREAKLFGNAEGFMLLAAPDVMQFIQEEDTQNLAEIETKLNKLIKCQAEPTFTREQFEIVLL